MLLRVCFSWQSVLWRFVRIHASLGLFWTRIKKVGRGSSATNNRFSFLTRTQRSNWSNNSFFLLGRLLTIATKQKQQSTKAFLPFPFIMEEVHNNNFFNFLMDDDSDDKEEQRVRFLIYLATIAARHTPRKQYHVHNRIEWHDHVATLPFESPRAFLQMY